MNRFPHDSWVLVKHVQSSTCERASLLACLAVAHRPVIFTATAAAATVDGAEQTRRRQQAVPYDVLEECKKMHTSAGYSAGDPHWYFESCYRPHTRGEIYRCLRYYTT